MRNVKDNMFLQFSAISLVAFIVICILLVTLLSNIIKDKVLDDAGEEAVADAAGPILEGLTPADFETPMTGERYSTFDGFLKEHVVSESIARVKLWATDATVIYSSDEASVGQAFPDNKSLLVALGGKNALDIKVPKDAENEHERFLGTLIEVYTPISFPGATGPQGVLEIYQYYEPTAQLIAELQYRLITTASIGFFILYISLMGIFWKGWRTIIAGRMAVARSNSLLRDSESRLKGALLHLKDASLDTIYRLAQAAEYKDNDTGSHIQRIGDYATAICKALGLDKEFIESMRYAAPMHDIGKIGIPDEILLKQDTLSASEWEVMKRHTTIGGDILSGSHVDFIRIAETIALTHHEKWDGSGYPRGLKGADISLAGRITAVADVFDALTSERPYKEPLSLEASFLLIKEGKGRHFDPDIVDAFLSVKDEIVSIRDNCSDRKESPSSIR